MAIENYNSNFDIGKSGKSPISVQFFILLNPRGHCFGRISPQDGFYSHPQQGPLDCWGSLPLAQAQMAALPAQKGGGKGAPGAPAAAIEGAGSEGGDMPEPWSPGWWWLEPWLL